MKVYARVNGERAVWEVDTTDVDLARRTVQEELAKPKYRGNTIGPVLAAVPK
jgi:hypothetical protein